MDQAELLLMSLNGILGLAVAALVCVVFSLRNELYGERCERRECQDRANVAEGIIKGMDKQRQVAGNEESGWRTEAEEWREIAKQIVERVGGVRSTDDA